MASLMNLAVRGTRGLAHAREIAETVRDPELPMLTLAQLGVLRDVRSGADGGVVVDLTPTYSGCPALATMRDDVVRLLGDAGFANVEVRIVLDPPWSSDHITAEGRAALAQAGIAPPGPAPSRSGPIPLTLSPTARMITCPRCGSPATELLSEFGATACKSLHRCTACLEPFEHVKAI